MKTLLCLSLLAFPAMADEPSAMIQVPAAQLKAIYEEYRDLRNDNIQLMGMVGDMAERIKQMEASKNCS